MRGILLIPVKGLSTAKQRLAPALSQSQRSQLAEAMLRDVMAAAFGVLGRIELVGRRLIDRHRASPGDRVRVLPGMQAQGFKRGRLWRRHAELAELDA